MNVKAAVAQKPGGNLVPLVNGQNYKIEKTRNYDQFKFLEGNREINELHLKRLTTSMKQELLFTLIYVNEMMEIIDGQHRFLALKNLGHAIYYLVLYGYRDRHVQIYNTNSNNWKKEDYLQSYVEKGLNNYIIFNKFMDEYPDFGFQSCERILTQLRNEKSTSFMGVGVSKKSFEKGELEIPNLEESYEIANKMMLIKPYYRNYHRSSFVSSMLGIFECPEYDHKEFLRKLQLQPKALVDCISITQYRELVESIYNYRRGKKVNLRFV